MRHILISTTPEYRDVNKRMVEDTIKKIRIELDSFSSMEIECVVFGIAVRRAVDQARTNMQVHAGGYNELQKLLTACIIPTTCKSLPGYQMLAVRFFSWLLTRFFTVQPK